MNATLCVVYDHMAGLGGDVFAQVWDPSDLQVHALNGSGRSGGKVTIDAYRSSGHDEIPARGPLAANTVPGVVDGWAQLHDRFGKLDWPRLFEDPIGYADNGFPISRKFRDYIDQKSDDLEPFETTSAIFLPDGRAPRAGSIIRQPDLAASLRAVQRDGADAFYRGGLAEKIVTGLRDAGGLLTLDDFADHHSDWVEPLRTTYRGLEVTELPPNTQGIATLLILNLIEKENVRALGDSSADLIHLVVEATKLAFADRDRWVTDPSAIDIPYERLLSKDYAAERRKAIDYESAAPAGEAEPGLDAAGGKGRREEPAASRRQRRGDAGDTVYMCAVDEDGQACSLIQSVYFEFGSGFVPPGTGILLQNRGSFFKLDPGHPNALAPGKRTFHTIIPAMALRDGQPSLLFGTMGGEGQPQSQVAMLTRLVDFGFDVQQAIEAPRWLYGRTWGEQSKSLKLEGRIADGTAEELRRRGHDVEMTENWSQKMGHAQAIWIDRDEGVLYAGADPRADGVALAR
jgi:gamma-glutamyltranspeptidase/glutathione hydrolase